MVSSSPRGIAEKDALITRTNKPVCTQSVIKLLGNARRPSVSFVIWELSENVESNP